MSIPRRERFCSYDCAVEDFANFVLEASPSQGYVWKVGKRHASV